MKEEKAVIECPFCNASVPESQVQEHMALLHPPIETIKSVGDAIAAGFREAQIQVALDEARAAIEEKYKSTSRHVKNNQLILNTRRGTRVDDGTPCTLCSKSDLTVWRYRDSNRGIVHICSICKPKVFDRSFGKIDALDKTVPGSYETNRRRH